MPPPSDAYACWGCVQGTLSCFVLCVGCLLCLALDGGRADAWLLLPSVLLLGVAIGPIQVTGTQSHTHFNTLTISVYNNGAS